MNDPLQYSYSIQLLSLIFDGHDYVLQTKVL